MTAAARTQAAATSIRGWLCTQPNNNKHAFQITHTAYSLLLKSDRFRSPACLRTQLTKNGMGQQEFVTAEGLRRDGRRAKELRRIKCQVGVLQSADGSAMFEMGNTQVLASVFGPREVDSRADMQQDKAIIKCEYAMAAFSTGSRRQRGKMDRRSTELSKVIRNTLEQTVCLELLPRSQIDVYVQVLQADGGTRCACINAASMALADAGIPMRDAVASCAVGYLQSTALLDLNYMEDAGGGPDISVAVHPNMDRLVLLQMDGKLPPEVFEECVALAVEGCKAVASVMRQELLRHTKRLAITTGVLGVQ